MMSAGAPVPEKGLCRESLAALQAEMVRRADYMLALAALMPSRLGGVLVEAASPDASAHLTQQLSGWMTGGGRAVRLPPGISDDALLGGLDLAATLAAGRPVIQPGLLSAADGRCLVIPMAERLPRQIAAQISRVLDCSIVMTEREGVSCSTPSTFAALLLSDPAEASETVPEILNARIAFRLPGAFLPAQWAPLFSAQDICEARDRAPAVDLPDPFIEAMAAACETLGIADPRVLAFACASMRGLAALSGEPCVQEAHAEQAASLVLGARAAPQMEMDQPPQPPPDEANGQDKGRDGQSVDDLAELVVAASRFSAQIDAAVRGTKVRKRMKGEVASGKSGEMVDSWQRGSRIDARAGDPRRQGRLDLIATLRAAAPWQKIRPRREGGAPIAIRAADFRLKRFRHRSEAVVIFAVDASGSTAMNRLAEAKGAVEFLLGGCYARRESVAVLAFRRQSAEVLLPPTRSLTRVKRSLAGLPGGGGTPLAAGISAAQVMSEQELRRRRSPYIVFLSDGQANVGLDGAGGREGGGADASRMARRLKGAHLPILFLDTSRRPNADARRLSDEMGAVYRPLPFADGKSVSDTVRQTLLS